MSSVKILKQKKTPGGTATPGEVLCQVGDHSPGDGVDDQGPRPRPRPWSASPRNGIPLAQSMELMTGKQFFTKFSGSLKVVLLTVKNLAYDIYNN